MMDHGMSAAQQPQRSSEEDDLWITNTDNIHKETSAAKLEIRRNGDPLTSIHSLVGIQSSFSDDDWGAIITPSGTSI